MDIFSKYDITSPSDALSLFMKRELRLTYGGQAIPFRYYYREGQGTPLIFVHGWGASASIWSYLGVYLSDHPVFILDLPGHGMNSNLNDATSLISYDFLFTVLDSLIDLLDGNPILVGHSMGGGIVQNFALHNPDLISGLILISTALSFRSFLPPALVDLLVSSASRLAEQLGEQFASYLAPRFLRASDLPENIQSATTRSLVNTLSSNDGEVIVAEYRNLIREWDGRKADPLDLPILILVGELDLLTPMTQAEAMNMHYPHSLLKIFPQSHHNLPLFNYKRVGDAVHMFLSLFP